MQWFAFLQIFLFVETTSRTERSSCLQTETMASQTAGIMQLLTAEKRAAEKINEARKRKNQRLKQAKQEAQAEVEKYRQVCALSFYHHHLCLPKSKFAGA